MSARRLTAVTRSANESGRTVRRSTVPDRPWPTSEASGVL